LRTPVAASKKDTIAWPTGHPEPHSHSCGGVEDLPRLSRERQPPSPRWNVGARWRIRTPHRDDGFLHRLCTDAYLAAFAISASCRVVSFDDDFIRFKGLSFLPPSLKELSW